MRRQTIFPNAAKNGYFSAFFRAQRSFAPFHHREQSKREARNAHGSRSCREWFRAFASRIAPFGRTGEKIRPVSFARAVGGANCFGDTL
ncbi:MAG: hypothetical protein AB7G28_24145 [Pirellulales bacterium]